jgi:plasmid stabilization system protein ParE
MRVLWSKRAEAGLEAFLDYLALHAPALVRRARDDAYSAAADLADFPFAQRAARWPGLRELPLRRWKKLIVYRVEADRVVIVAFFDLRQDLGTVAPMKD